MAPRAMSVRARRARRAPDDASVAEGAVADPATAVELVQAAAAVAQEDGRARPAVDLAATEVRVHDVVAGARDDDVPAVPRVDEVLARPADELVELRLRLARRLVVT